MAVALTDWAAATHIGFSKMISMGNKSDIDENYLLKQLQNHRKHTEVIELYLESIQKGKEFLEITKTLSKQLPIVLIKS
jgi:acetyltransferase